MKNSVLLPASLFLLISLNIFSQVTQQWVKRYPYVPNLLASGVASVLDDQGNLYVTGSAEDENASYTDYTVTVKYNSAGNVLWIKRFYGFEFSRPRDIAVDEHCNVYITGGANRYLYGAKDFFTIKYSSSGEELWIRYYAGSGNSYDEASDIAVDHENNIYSAGESENYSAAIVKYSPSGDVLWSKSFSSGNIIRSVGELIIDSQNKVILTGLYGGSQSAVVKLNSHGTILWNKLYNTYYNQGSGINSSVIDEENNIYLFGNTEITGNRIFCFTVKYDTDGEEEWTRVYRNSELPNTQSHAVSIASNRKGGVYLGGFCGGTMGIGPLDFFVINYSSSGDSVWVKKYSNGNTNYLRKIKSDLNGNLYLAGQVSSPQGVAWGTMKFNSAGNMDWYASYPGEESGYDIEINNSGDVFVTGTNFLGMGTSDITTIKYSYSLTGINIIPNETPSHFSLSQNYPNPFNPATTINFSIPSVETTRRVVSLKVYNIFGSEVATLVNQQLTPGTYSVNWDASNHPSGVYFYRLSSGEFSATQKMILLK